MQSVDAFLSLLSSPGIPAPAKERGVFAGTYSGQCKFGGLAVISLKVSAKLVACGRVYLGRTISKGLSGVAPHNQRRLMAGVRCIAVKEEKILQRREPLCWRMVPGTETASINFRLQVIPMYTHDPISILVLGAERSILEHEKEAQASHVPGSDLAGANYPGPGTRRNGKREFSLEPVGEIPRIIVPARIYAGGWAQDWRLNR